jgi:transcriptional regulator with XRE-family HTH domain
MQVLDERTSDAEPEKRDDRGAHDLEQIVARTIGIRVHEERKRRNLTLEEVASRASVSVAMVSRIENGNVSLSLRTLTRIAIAVDVPVTALLRGLDEERDASFVKAGHGLALSPEHGHAHRYELLAVPVHARRGIEPHLITLPDASAALPLYQHDHIELFYMLKGRISFRYGRNLYELSRGDTLIIDGLVLHGPERILKPPAQFLAIAVERLSSDR